MYSVLGKICGCCAGNVYDFEDFSTAVASSNSGNMDVITMRNEDFRNLKSDVSQAKLKAPNRPKLADIAQVKFVRGKHTLFYKSSFSEESFTEFSFLKKSHKCTNPGPLRTSPRGVTSEKKKLIIAKLCPLMPENRRTFWKDLPENAAAEDLIDND